jgi:hypothetical protein
LQDRIESDPITFGPSFNSDEIEDAFFQFGHGLLDGAPTCHESRGRRLSITDISAAVTVSRTYNSSFS